MSEITIDSENIAEIRNALQVIQLNAEFIYGTRQDIQKSIFNQVSRIDKLLPVVKFEGGK